MTQAPDTPVRIIAIANQKGGVGKTTTAMNLGAAAAAMEQRCLIIDMDPQGNASTGLGLKQADRTVTTYEVLMNDAAIADGAVETTVPGLDILPAVADLAGAEAEVLGEERRHYRLRRAIEQLQAHIAEGRARDYRYVYIDCPPSLNVLTVNALTAADTVLVPLQCEFFALEGITQMDQTISLVRNNLNPSLEYEGVLMTMVDGRNNLAKEVEADVRAHFKELVYETVIPRNVKVAEAPAHGLPVILYDRTSTGAQAYLNLAREVLRRDGVVPLAA